MRGEGSAKADWIVAARRLAAGADGSITRSSIPVQGGEPVGEQAVDLVGTFLLDPVAAAVQEVGGGQGREGGGESIDGVGHPGGGSVQGAADEKGGLTAVLTGSFGARCKMARPLADNDGVGLSERAVQRLRELRDSP